MYDILICEDDKIQLNQITKIITNLIMIEDFPMKVILSTNSPEEIISHIISNLGTNFIYFLDIDLDSYMNGIELAEKIREIDSLGKLFLLQLTRRWLP